MHARKASQKTTRGKTQHPESEHDVRERILSVFSKRAQKSGIRAVKMGQLAGDLRMSATTLYRHFASKDELVQAMVLRWAEDLSASEAALPDDSIERSVDEHMLLWAEAWGESLSRYMPEFWRDLRDDHPEAWRLFKREVRRRKSAGAELLKPHIASGLSVPMALAVLDLLIEHAADPELCSRIGISRSDAVRTAIRIWRQGALRRPDE